MPEPLVFLPRTFLEELLASCVIRPISSNDELLAQRFAAVLKTIVDEGQKLDA